MNKVLSDYHSTVCGIITEIANEENTSLEKAASLIAAAWENNRKIYIFGCTHSGILAEDVFYRAGAPAFWQPLWGPGMNIATQPGFLTSAMEHSEDAGKAIIDCSCITKDDVLVLISTSGKNAAPVQVAKSALSRGVKLIIISSSAYRNECGNHSSIPSLWNLQDECVIIDNHVPLGDCSITVDEFDMGPLSTIAGSFILHGISAMTISLFKQKKIKPDVFKSSNAPGGKEYNEKLLKSSDNRTKFLLP